MNELSVTV